MHTVAIPRKCKDMDDAGFRRRSEYVCEKPLQAWGVIPTPVHGGGSPAAGVPMAQNQTINEPGTSHSSIPRRSWLEANLGGVGAERVERNLMIAPAREGLADITLALYGECLSFSAMRGQGSGSHSAPEEERFDDVAAATVWKVGQPGQGTEESRMGERKLFFRGFGTVRRRVRAGLRKLDLPDVFFGLKAKTPT